MALGPHGKRAHEGVDEVNFEMLVASVAGKLSKIMPLYFLDFVAHLGLEVEVLRHPADQEYLVVLATDVAFDELVFVYVLGDVEANLLHHFTDAAVDVVLVFGNLAAWERPRLGLDALDEQQLGQRFVEDGRAPHGNAALVLRELLERLLRPDVPFPYHGTQLDDVLRKRLDL